MVRVVTRSDPSEITRAESRTGRMIRELQAMQRRLHRIALCFAFVAIVEVLLALFLLRLWWTR